MNVNEQLAVLTALKKAVDERLKEVRSGADEAMRDAYEEDGVEKALKVCGEKVGELRHLRVRRVRGVGQKAFEELPSTTGWPP
ncbi:MAG: hypothetical protein ACLR3C_06995 [Eggerthella lenta]